MKIMPNKDYLSPEMLLEKMKADGKMALGISGGLLMNSQGSILNQGLGGAMAGFSTAGPLGALLGLGFGLVGGAKRRGDEQAAARRMFDNNISARAGTPSYYAKSGGIVSSLDGNDLVKVQGQRGENVALPDASIVDLHSKKEHSQMKRKETTDYLPVGAWIGDKKTMVSKKEADKLVIGADPGMYKEHEKGVPFKEVKVGDAFKAKNANTAKRLEEIKDYIKIPESLENDIYDPLALATAKDNRGTRAKFIGGLMELVARKNKLLRSQMQNL